MNRKRKKVYIKLNSEKKEFVYTGIEFYEFIKFLLNPIENLIIITGGHYLISNESKIERGLELFNGQQCIINLSKENIYNLGNFCFVDYDRQSKVTDLSEAEIAELLYLGHMFKPLKSPFFKPIHNRFVYLSHDDGWYCKLYCNDYKDIISILFGKINHAFFKGKRRLRPSSYADLQDALLGLMQEGLLIDLDELLYGEDSSSVKLYSVGEYTDMDTLLNNWEDIKGKSTHIVKLSSRKGEWVMA
ncbi:hypothetical protein LJC34_02480 [Oscillospiraceae bacterium OttesenSCG-928-G22]|nr:hypothetical protein [Oscillospiraceae bacterium OttesenSCG-928-G22]